LAIVDSATLDATGSILFLDAHLHLVLSFICLLCNEDASVCVFGASAYADNIYFADTSKSYLKRTSLLLQAKDSSITLKGYHSMTVRMSNLLV